MPNIQQPPRAKKVEHITEMHGHTLIDNYYWLKDQSISNPEVLAQIAAENAYAEAVLAKSKSLQEKIYREMLHRNNKNTESGKLETEIHYTQIGDWFYWEKAKNKNDQFNVHYRKKSESGTEEVVLDLNEVAKKYEYFIAEQIQYTPDHNYILIDCRFNNHKADLGKIHLTLIFDVEAKMFLEPLKSCETILVDERNVIIYFCSPENGRYCRVKKHQIGADQTLDEMLFYENSSYQVDYFYQSESGKYLMLYIHNYNNSECWLMDLDVQNSKFKCFSPKMNDEWYMVYHSGEYFYIMTNIDGANNFKLMRTTLDKTDKKYWQEIIPHSETVRLGFTIIEPNEPVVCVFKNYLVWREMGNGLQKIKFINNLTRDIKEIEIKIDAPFHQIYFISGDYDGDKFSFLISSFDKKTVEFEYDFITGKLEQIWEKKLNNFDQNLYQSEIVFAEAKDGAKIPIHLFYRKDLFKKNGTNPLFVEGYSACGDHSDNFFIAERISLVDRGFVYTYVHMRGSGYFGYKWYQAGIRKNKINRFEDFIEGTEYLINNNFGDRNKVVAYGASAGANIMGYIANNRPNLYSCIFSLIPSIDILNELIDGDAGNNGSHVVENGNIKNKDEFEYILLHDPYNNIKQQSYPNIISIASLYDTQTGYWEPIKWINRIRDYKIDNNQQFVLLLNEGHGGATTPNWSERIYSTGYAYICDLFGITD